VEIKQLNISNNGFSGWSGEGLEGKKVKELEANGVHCVALGLVTKIMMGRWSSLSLLKLSHNSIDTATLNTLLPKILQTPLHTLSVSSNPIGDAGCQLIAASLSSLSNLQHIDVSFCQISCKGISTLSRSALGCETLKSLGLAGNSIRVQAAISLSFMLAHHPRVSKLVLDNCSLCKVAQCYLVAGISSNRWVPMKHLTGFKVGPPLAEIGLISVHQQGFMNEVCFKIQRDNMLNEILQATGEEPKSGVYGRMMRYMTRIPFDDDELMELRKFFYDEPVIGWAGEEDNNIEKALEKYLKNQKLNTLWDGQTPGAAGSRELKNRVVGLDIGLPEPLDCESNIGSPFGMMRKYDCFSQGLDEGGESQMRRRLRRCQRRWWRGRGRRRRGG
jgi:hypothetical protein